MWIVQIVNKRTKKVISEHQFNDNKNDILNQMEAYKFKRINEMKNRMIRGKMIHANTV